MPSAAMVANTLAISIGVVDATPRVNEPQPLAYCGEDRRWSTEVRNSRPSRLAISTAFAAPIFCSTCTQYVLTDMPKPDHMFCVPVSAPLALDGHQWPPQDAPPPPR